MANDPPPTLVEGAVAGLAETMGAEASPGVRTGGDIPPGTSVGRYFVLGRLGAGGMGVVYAAYDPKLDRKVAIKLLHDGAGGSAGVSEGRERLLREAQAMAKLSHPNVVTVHDVGTWRDRVFVAMEFVDGQTLRDWSIATRRTWREIVRVMIRAGRGLAAAHAAGLVHRDFKPENVMIDNGGHVRVMDFGLARATDLDLPPVADVVRSTEPRALGLASSRVGTFAGTPAYMAPEQMRSEQPDPTTDQFAFGVTLWELLLGRRPFVGDSLGELVANMTDGKIAPVPEGSRVPAWLRRVASTAFSTARDARFPSMDALLAALARDPTRTRLRFGATVGIAAVALGGIGWQRIGAARKVSACEADGAAIAEVWGAATREPVHSALLATGAAHAPVTWEKLAPWLDSYAEEWSRLRTRSCLETESEGVRSRELFEQTRDCLDERRLALDRLTKLLLQADSAGVQSAVLVAARLPLLSQCRDDRWLAQRVRLPEDEASRAIIASATDQLIESKLLYDAGKYGEAMTSAQDALEIARGLDWVPLTARAEAMVGVVAERTGDFALAQASGRASFFAAGGAGADETMADAATLLVGVLGRDLAQYEQGLEWGELAGMALRRLGAERGLRAASLASGLGSTHQGNGKFELAMTHHRAALEIRESILGPDHPDVGLSLVSLGIAYLSSDQPDASLSSLERARDIYVAALGADHPYLALVWGNIGNVYDTRRDNERAMAAYRRSLEITERTSGSEHVNVAGMLVSVGNVQYRRREYDDALASYRRALGIYQRVFGPEHPAVALCLNNMGSLAFDRGDLAAAFDNFASAVAIVERTVGPDHVNLAMPLNGLGRVALTRHDARAAAVLLERALAIRERERSDPIDLAETRFGLTRALWESGADRARATSLAEQALVAYRAGGDAFNSEIEEIDAWLAAHADAPGSKRRR